MTRIRLFTLLGATVALVLGSALFKSNELHAQPAADLLMIGQPAPAWTLKDLDGNEVKSSQFAGKVVVVDFWATWCTPCIQEIPGYIELQKKYGADGLVIIGVTVDRKAPTEVKKFVEQKGMNYTVVVADEKVAEDFGGIEGIPTTFLIDREGKFAHKKVGAMTHSDYEALVKKVLK
jgi:peroxiredoxin